MEEDGSTRRSFLSKLFAGTLLAGIAGTLASVLAYLLPPHAVGSALGPEWVKVGRAKDIPLGEGRLTLANDDPAWIVHLARGLVGTSAVCTHRGCIVNWDAKRRLFECPCHAGLFDERGNVLSGLPLQPLPRFRVALIRGDLYVARNGQKVG